MYWVRRGGEYKINRPFQKLTVLVANIDTQKKE